MPKFFHRIIKISFRFDTQPIILDLESKQCKIRNRSQEVILNSVVHFQFRIEMLSYIIVYKQDQINLLMFICNTKKQFFIVNYIFLMRRRSLTFQQKACCIQQFNSLKEIKVYLRRANRQTTIIKITNKLSGKNLFNLASQKTNIELSNLVLFHKGQKIQNSQMNHDKIYQLYQNDILHVHEITNVRNRTIQITLKPFQCLLQQINIMQVQSNQKIGVSFAKCFNINSDLAFVESGRKLNLEKTFQEEYIQNESTIIVTSFIQQKQRYNLQKLQKKDLSIPQKKQKSLQYEDIRQFKPKPMLRKTVSWSSVQNFNNFNFKKKQKPSIYKSQRISQGKEIIWESDSSSDLQTKLRKKLAIKKQKQKKQIKQQRTQQLINPNQMRQDHIQVSDQEDNTTNLLYSKKQRLFSSHDRIQLQKQLKKLLFSDLFEQRSKQKQNQKQKQKIQQMKQLQPPQMQTDDFLQIGQSQQLIIKQDIDSDEDQQEQQQKQIDMARQLIFRTPINLRQSIGKSKGVFMVPTTDQVKN